MEYSRLPAIDNGFLSFAGETRNGLAFDDRDDLGVQVYYDPPPYPLSRGQLARTYCVGLGVEVAALRPPLTGNWFYTDHRLSKSQSQCPDPYSVPADTPGPGSPKAANAAWQLAYDASQNMPDQYVTGPWLTASRWQANGSDFSVQANISQVTDFYGIDPPTAYSSP